MSATAFRWIGVTVALLALGPAAGAVLAAPPWLTAKRVADLRPGPVGSAPAQLTNVGGTLFFTADDGVNGRELWKSDGTAAGTVPVADIAPGPGSSDPTQLTAMGDVLFFAADDGVNGRELWRSDGTAAGTGLVADLVPGVGTPGSRS
jgi:ELWxxDGT repeat protein